MSFFKSIGKLVKTVASPVATFLGGPVAGTLAGIGSSLLSYKGGKERNQAASAVSQRQMDFQERMSSTAHQRQVEDLRSAGLNPILSATKGGSSTPGGASYDPVDVLSPAASSAMQYRLLNNQIQKSKQEVELVKAQTKKTKVEADVTDRTHGGAVGKSWEYLLEKLIGTMNWSGTNTSSAADLNRSKGNNKYPMIHLKDPWIKRKDGWESQTKQNKWMRKRSNSKNASDGYEYKLNPNYNK